MPDEDKKSLIYNQGEKSMRVPFIIYADLECLREKMHLCQNNLEKSYTEKNWAYTFCLFMVYKLFLWCNKK